MPFKSNSHVFPHTYIYVYAPIHFHAYKCMVFCVRVCINSVNSWEKQWLLVHLLSVCGDEVEHPLLPWRSCTWVCASWDLTESSQTEWFPVWAACKTRELLELKIALGLMVWALPEPGRVLDLRRKRTSEHQQRTERIREWRHGPGEGGVRRSLFSGFSYFTKIPWFNILFYLAVLLPPTPNSVTTRCWQCWCCDTTIKNTWMGNFREFSDWHSADIQYLCFDWTTNYSLSLLLCWWHCVGCYDWEKKYVSIVCLQT